ncbi:MAG: trypsin-like peptidase domain-containing protein, partial [Anaerolineae bacterium]|nr:trypsin-like peptidase domain-containing protein [Anaerolineae bacterium]
MSTRRPLLMGALAVALILTLFTGGLAGGVAGYYLAGREAKPATPAPVLASAPLTETFATQPASAPSPAPTTSALLASDPANDALVAAVARVQPATVTVLNRSAGGSGSGVFIDKGGHLLTNNHVVEDGRSFQIIYDDGGRAPATLVGTAPEFDLAVLKVSGRVPAWAPLGDSAAMPVGSRVAAIGSALGGFRNTVTAGVLSAHNRSLGELDGLLQTDAAINQGNSGGPLINLAGEIIGINTMVLRGGFGDVAEGLGFAVPSNVAKAVASQLIAKGKVDRPYLGITYEPLNPQLAEENGLDVTTGAFIQSVVPGGPSNKAGLKAKDVILAINEQQLDDHYTLAQVLLRSAVGDVVTLQVARGRESLTL